MELQQRTPRWGIGGIIPAKKLKLAACILPPQPAETGRGSLRSGAVTMMALPQVQAQSEDAEVTGWVPPAAGTGLRPS